MGKDWVFGFFIDVKHHVSTIGFSFQIIVCTRRRASTISYTWFCLFSPGFKFIIRYSIFIIHYSSPPFYLSPFAFRLSNETGVYRMHAEACVYDFVYLVFSVFTRSQIHHSIFNIHYSLFFSSLLPFAFRLSNETGVYRMHAEACVYDFVYLVFSVFTRSQIHHSIFNIHYSLFFSSLLPFAFLPTQSLNHSITQSLNP